MTYLKKPKHHIFKQLEYELGIIVEQICMSENKGVILIRVSILDVNSKGGWRNIYLAKYYKLAKDVGYDTLKAILASAPNTVEEIYQHGFELVYDNAIHGNNILENPSRRLIERVSTGEAVMDNIVLKDKRAPGWDDGKKNGAEK